ncbi:helicase-exonuclease AddAB subunit AddA [Butyrivibrio sp. CB08]|uniref:helicase-exonuclease AddAB subunit AddA n=1 Tax=Butyrivibrio sp. CB08 TaxID=2364879 RepID=UPI000EA9F2DD|nr:helicase-exonuclease AddAB subunit AddA [Butyrivibrio sp. CB08]RKM61950.1 helicase-exonuclease AddAB subunit AddA [Butyrivibrio sp. CB08]
MGVQFTPEQQSVIDERNSNLLVSAAAGSGKTAVLVERIIQMISNDLDVDHLLVVTFTKAAAAQMREKITLAIQNNLLEDPDNVHLQRQETLIHNAQITTIDSFCQYVIRNNFGSIGIDPALRVADEGELKLISEDVMQQMLEEEYEKAKSDDDSDFLFCMDYFATGSRDDKVEEYINQLFDFSMSMPWPEDWIRERAYDYDIDEDEFEELPWVKECLYRTGVKLREFIDKLDSAMDIANEPDGPYMYGDTLEDDKASIGAVLQYDTYNALFDGIRGITFGNLSGKKDPGVNPEKREAAKAIRDGVKKEIEKLRERYFALTRDTIVSQMKLCDRAVKELCRLTLEYKERFEEKKREKQVIDFPDMEHLALQILVQHPDQDKCQGKSVQEIIDMCTPSNVALEYREYYREVLIDEYQDSNNVQELILKSISGEVADTSERFMVGDVKQSIYKFRLARPEIFMDKFKTYDREAGSGNRRIDLHMNFRSRSEVLDLSNYIFKKIMGSDLGGVDYDEDARLVFGKTDFPEPAFDVNSEFLMVDGSDLFGGGDGTPIEDYNPREKEALAIAERIHELKKENPDIKYKDIVILLRSLSGWDSVFKEVLESQGIPTYIESKKGYFDAPEVAILLDMLSIVDNPRQDIPLIAVMHSPLGSFTDEELAQIRIAIDKDKELALSDSFYDALTADLNLTDVLKNKVKTFVSMIEEYRIRSTYTPVHELLQDIIDRTDYELLISAQPYGVQRRANVELLITNALNFEKTSFKGLFHFVRYIEHIKVVQVDYGEAGTIDENADVVRIMSIHKSKGLEFPVVFVSGIQKQFNMRETTGDLILDMDFGLGVKCIDAGLRVKYDTLKRRIVSDSMKLDSIGEEIRVLYVALTRAKEKVILTMFSKDLADTVSKALGKIKVLGGPEDLLPYSMRAGADSFFDMIMPAVVLNPGFKDILDRYQISSDEYSDRAERAGKVPTIRFRAVTGNDLTSSMISSQVEAALRKENLKSMLMGDGADKELLSRIQDKFSAVYSFDALKGLFTKTTVSELKHARMIEEGEVFTEPAAFAADSEKELSKSQADSRAAGATTLTGAERGTAYHSIMELLDDTVYGDEALMAMARETGKTSDRSKASDKVYGFIMGKIEKGVIPETYRECVWSPDIVTFLATDLGQRMGEAYRRGELFREKPFMMGVSASELKPQFPDEEMVLVQGIIDAWFIEDDEIILLDYKTDRVDDEDTLIRRYKLQLELYKRALEAATKKKVKEVYIYSFDLGSVIKL